MKQKHYFITFLYGTLLMVSGYTTTRYILYHYQVHFPETRQVIEIHNLGYNLLQISASCHLGCVSNICNTIMLQITLVVFTEVQETSYYFIAFLYGRVFRPAQCYAGLMILSSAICSILFQINRFPLFSLIWSFSFLRLFNSPKAFGEFQFLLFIFFLLLLLLLLSS